MERDEANGVPAADVAAAGKKLNPAQIPEGYPPGRPGQ